MQVFVPIPGAHDASHMRAQHADASGVGDHQTAIPETDGGCPAIRQYENIKNFPDGNRPSGVADKIFWFSPAR